MVEEIEDFELIATGNIKVEKKPKRKASPEYIEKIEKLLKEKGWVISKREKYQKGKIVTQRKPKNENPCIVCGKTNWNPLPDGRKYCLSCGGIDTDKKPIHELPKPGSKEIDDFELVFTLPEKKPKKHKYEEITDFVLGG